MAVALLAALAAATGRPWIFPSLGPTAFLADAEHPPAGATTLIVALGFLSAPIDLGVAMAAIAGLVGLCAALNRLARASRRGSRSADCVDEGA